MQLSDLCQGQPIVFRAAWNRDRWIGTLTEPREVLGTWVVRSVVDLGPTRARRDAASLLFSRATGPGWVCWLCAAQHPHYVAVWLTQPQQGEVISLLADGGVCRAIFLGYGHAKIEALDSLSGPLHVGDVVEVEPREGGWTAGRLVLRPWGEMTEIRFDERHWPSIERAFTTRHWPVTHTGPGRAVVNHPEGGAWRVLALAEANGRETGGEW